MKPVISVLDKQNKHIPYWSMTGMDKTALIGVSISYAIFWLFIHKFKVFKFKSAFYTGILTSFSILFTYYYFIMNIPYSIYGDNSGKNKLNEIEWLVLYQPAAGEETDDDIITDLSKYKEKWKLNLETDGVLMSDEFIKKNNIKGDNLSSINPPNPKGTETPEEQRIADLIHFKTKTAGDQSYDLFVIIFTISTLAYIVNITLFKRLIIPFFKFALLPAITINFFFFFFYSYTQGKITNNIRTYISFLSTSLAISILVEMLYTFS